MTRQEAKHLIGKKIKFQVTEQNECAWGIGEIDFDDGKLFIYADNQNVKDRSGAGEVRLIPLTQEQQQSLLSQGEKDLYEIGT